MRATFDDNDYKVLTSNPRFLVAVDAFRQGYCTVAQVIGMSFDKPIYNSSSLSPRAFASLVVKIAQDLGAGVLLIDSDAKLKYKHFYLQQETNLE